MSFRLAIQDYRHLHFGDPHPAKDFRYFASREEVIKKFGAKPGIAHPKYPEGFGVEGTFNLLGPLLIALGASGRASMIETVDRCIAADVCPAIVCLTGPSQSGKRGTYSFGSLLLPMANYADSVLAPAA